MNIPVPIYIPYILWAKTSPKNCHFRCIWGFRDFQLAIIFPQHPIFHQRSVRGFSVFTLWMCHWRSSKNSNNVIPYHLIWKKLTILSDWYSTSYKCLITIYCMHLYAHSPTDKPPTEKPPFFFLNLSTNLLNYNKKPASQKTPCVSHKQSTKSWLLNLSPPPERTPPQK